MTSALRNYSSASRAFLPIVAFAASAWAQGTGEIHGTLLDPNSLAVSKATVRATHSERGLTRTAITGDAGDFVFPLLPIGTYSLAVEQQGFKLVRRSGVELTANENVRVDLRLELGAVSEVVSVTSDAPMVNTRSSTLGTLIDSRRVIELPINGRNIVSLAQLLPGVTSFTAPQLLLEDRDGPTIAVAGSRPNQNLFLFDGAHFNALFRNTGLNYPPPDALQEVKVLTNSFSAEYGRNAGAIVNVVTRSGSNQIHGSAWEFLRNQKLNARNFFAPTLKPKLIQNQFGGAGGGPIRKNTLFAFGSYEGLKLRPDALNASAFPLTEIQRRGDFSAVRTPIRDPLTNQPFPNNQIPAARFDTVSKSILDRNLMPLPNRPDGQLVEVAAAPQNANQFLLRLDWNKGRHTVDGRYNFNQATATQYAGQVPSYITIAARTRGQNITIGDTFSITPSVLNQFRASFNRIAAISDSTNVFSHGDLGGNLPLFGPKLPPGINLTGRVTLSNNSPTVPGRANETWQFSDSVSFSKGRHTLKAGADIFLTRLVSYTIVNTMGVFTFNGQLTGDPASDFLIGRPSSMDIGSPVRHQGGNQTSSYYFVQDDWKVSKRLTLNLGLRYELPLPWYHPNDFWGTLAPGRKSQVIPSAPLGMLYPGDPGIPRGIVPTDKNNFAPRFGFALDPSGSGLTSIRGAYGVFYETINGDIIQNEGQPFSYTFTIPAPFSFTDPLRGQAPIPTSIDFNNPLFTGRQQLSYPDPNLKTGYIHQFNLGVQRQVLSSLVIQAGYVGRAGHKQMTSLPSNPAIFGPGATLANINQRRLLPDFGNNRVIGTQANSNFHSFQFEATKRLSRGFSLQGAYTFSKSIDQTSTITTGLGNAAPNVFNLSSERGLSDFNAAHIASFSWLWEIPQAKFQNGLARTILHGWQVNGLVSMRTGRPLNILSGRDDALSGTVNQRPDLVGDHRLPGDRSRNDKILSWFNAAAFAFPAPGTYGNLGRNALTGPSSAVMNAAVFKNFVIPAREGMRLQFRSEFFNALNSVNFAAPNNSLSAGIRMGRITAADDARVIQLALKLLF